MSEKLKIVDFIYFLITILIFGFGLGALISLSIINEYKIIIFVFFFFLVLIYLELWRSNKISRLSHKFLYLIFTQLNLMGTKKVIKRSTVDEEFNKLENEIKDKNEFEQSLGAGFWDLFTIILFIVLIIIVAAFAADYLQ
jgi:hypothetical protein